MDLHEQIQNDLVAAMKAKDELRTSTLRMAKAAIKNREIETQQKLDPVEVMKVLSSLVKQRKDSVEQYQKANRTDLAEKELQEIQILEGYLPKALSRESIEEAVTQVITELGATSLKEMGNVMKSTMARLAGQTVDGKVVSEIVRSKLGG